MACRDRGCAEAGAAATATAGVDAAAGIAVIDAAATTELVGPVLDQQPHVVVLHHRGTLPDARHATAPFSRHDTRYLESHGRLIPETGVLSTAKCIADNPGGYPADLLSARKFSNARALDLRVNGNKHDSRASAKVCRRTFRTIFRDEAVLSRNKPSRRILFSSRIARTSISAT